jgi:hypothetical protein
VSVGIQPHTQHHRLAAAFLFARISHLPQAKGALAALQVASTGMGSKLTLTWLPRVSLKA